jgi:uncharacterized Zn ribbon protein
MGREKGGYKINKLIICPSCGAGFTEQHWNDTTTEIVKSLNGDDAPVILYKDRKEGTAFRCSNIQCEDEVVTDADGNLITDEDNHISRLG